MTVVVLGQFSSGKSTLLNALLEDPEGIFPVDSYLSTRVVTSARWGQPETITLTLTARPETRRRSRAGSGGPNLRAYISEAEVQRRHGRVGRRPGEVGIDRDPQPEAA